MREEQGSNSLVFQKHPQRQYSSIRSMHMTILKPRDATPIDYYFLCVLQLTMKICNYTKPFKWKCNAVYRRRLSPSTLNVKRTTLKSPQFTLLNF